MIIHHTRHCRSVFEIEHYALRLPKNNDSLVALHRKVLSFLSFRKSGNSIRYDYVLSCYVARLPAARETRRVMKIAFLRS